MEWEKIVAKDTTDKGLTSEICKQCIQFNSKKTNNPTEKYSEHLTDLSPKKTQGWPTGTWKNAQHH